MNPQKLQLELVLTTGKRSKPKKVFIRRVGIKNHPLLQIVQRVGKKEEWKIVPLGEHIRINKIQHENKKVDLVFEYNDFDNPGKRLTYFIKNIFWAQVTDKSKHFKDVHYPTVHGNGISVFALSYFKWASNFKEPNENSIINMLKRFKEMGKADKKD